MVQGSKWEMTCSEKALSTSGPGHGHSLPVTKHWDKQDRVNTDSERNTGVAGQVKCKE